MTKRRIFNRHIVYNNYICLKNLTDNILIHPTILSVLNKGDTKNLQIMSKFSGYGEYILKVVLFNLTTIL